MTTQLINEAEALLAKARNQLHTQKDTQQMEITTKPAAPANAELTAAVAALYTGGKSIVEVASALSITYGKARKLLAASGTPLRDSSERLKGRTRPVKATA